MNFFEENPKATLTAFIGALAVILKFYFGWEMPVEVQGSFVVVILIFITWFIRIKKSDVELLKLAKKFGIDFDSENNKPEN